MQLSSRSPTTVTLTTFGYLQQNPSTHSPDTLRLNLRSESSKRNAWSLVWRKGIFVPQRWIRSLDQGEWLLTQLGSSGSSEKNSLFSASILAHEWVFGSPPRTRQHKAILIHECSFLHLVLRRPLEAIQQELAEYEQIDLAREGGTGEETRAIRKPVRVGALNRLDESITLGRRDRKPFLGLEMVALPSLLGFLAPR